MSIDSVSDLIVSVLIVLVLVVSVFTLAVVVEVELDGRDAGDLGEARGGRVGGRDDGDRIRRVGGAGIVRWRLRLTWRSAVSSLLPWSRLGFAVEWCGELLFL